MADGTVRIISETVQEFEGVRYYLCGKYFQKNGKRLHRAVWEYFNGEIPEGYHIHHINQDRACNDIENLALMPGIDHMTEHAREESRRENGKRAIRFAIAAAPEWHRSEAGHEWHSKHAKMVFSDRKPHEETCTECGKKYITTNFRKKGNHFCSNKCRAAHRRKSGVDNEQRVCPVCGNTFTANKYSRSKACSATCAWELRRCV